MGNCVRIYNLRDGLGYTHSCVWICSFYQDVLGYTARCIRICSLKSNMGLDIQKFTRCVRIYTVIM